MPTEDFYNREADDIDEYNSEIAEKANNTQQKRENIVKIGFPAPSSCSDVHNLGSSVEDTHTKQNTSSGENNE